ncbi:uncharacterized protein LOC125646762 isoform X2 [Ostrea edulis]|uniref:uncharacterized protein LOC125646762 isoform X2 n=1 Tax=Ostrea edulis TaxID=37623 RepID=UPI0024AF04C7|nr:uncharacterized protein LOC125646762 isoform X2 [Ostrea edulis]
MQDIRLTALLLDMYEPKSQKLQGAPNGCQCVGYNCGCCQHLEVDKIGLNDTVCINVTYLDKDYGLEVTLSVDGHVYMNVSVSARNPPPLCAAIPGLKDLASICLQFYNLSVSSTSFYGCIKLVAKLKYVTVEKINIGCLRIPPSSQHQVEFVDAGALTLMDTSVKVKTGYSKVPLLKKYYITNQE